MDLCPKIKSKKIKITKQIITEPKFYEESHSYIECILRDINQISKVALQESTSRREFHTEMQHRIFQLAERFNLKSLNEYWVPNIRADGRGGLIDVVWLADSRPVTAFEIDSSPRYKSIKKLLSIDVPFPFWVYYGSKYSTQFIHRYDFENRIQVIQLPKYAGW